jgi:site-specific recombinase XerD
MTWEYWITLYTRTHCVARGLRSTTIEAYVAALGQFRAFARFRLEDRSPAQVSASDVLLYLEYLRTERRNGPAAVNRTVVILRGFYRAIAAMGHLDPRANPMAGFPNVRAAPRKLPVVLSPEETQSLLAVPRSDTVMGLRDRALLALLYGTGIRVSECCGLRNEDVDLAQLTVHVTGKGGHQRTVPFNEVTAATLERYLQARGRSLPAAPFFLSRGGRAMSRGVVYERVRSSARKARLGKIVSPHRLRHTFATHLVRAGVGLVTIRDLLGHRLITSTQLYLHVTAEDLRDAARRHPIARLLGTIEHLLPDVRLPFQHRARSPRPG